MLSRALADVLAPFAMMANKNAMKEIYRCLQIEPHMLRAVAPYGILEAYIDIGIPVTTFVDTLQFHQVIKSLPAGHDVLFDVKGGAVTWECDTAEGRIAMLPPQTLPEIDQSAIMAGIAPSEAFLDALELGALSCGGMSSQTLGAYGIVFDNSGDEFVVMSTDNVTLSTCMAWKERKPQFPDKLTLHPNAVDLLREVAKGKPEDVLVDFGHESVRCVNKKFNLTLKPAPALKHDLRSIAERMNSRSVLIPIPHERMQGFIRRVAALAETKQTTNVTLRIADGAMALSFAEGVSTSDEYYITKDLDAKGTFPDITLDAQRVSRALQHSTHLVFDHLKDKVLLLVGDNPPFTYMIAARAN